MPAEGRHGAVPQRQVRQPGRLVEFLKAQGAAARVQGTKIVLQGEMKTEAERIKAAFAIARDLAEKVREVSPAKTSAGSAPAPRR